MEPDSGLVRAAYLALVTGFRRALEGTSLLAAWDRLASRRPRSRAAHLRTLVAVHNIDDLVQLDLPWWTYRAIDVVGGYLAGLGHSARVFEYGSGASTIWLARRASSVDSVEHDGAWAARVRELATASDGLRCSPVLHVPDVPYSRTPRVPSGAPSGKGRDFADYVAAIGRTAGQFDLVLVDGRAREAALLEALDRVSPHGLLLLDDAQRQRYQGAVRAAELRGWCVLRTHGATPCQPFPRETVLLSRQPLSMLGSRAVGQHAEPAGS